MTSMFFFEEGLYIPGTDCGRTKYYLFGHLPEQLLRGHTGGGCSGNGCECLSVRDKRPVQLSQVSPGVHKEYKFPSSPNKGLCAVHL
ncbi:hypothetical protein D5086_012842 [Populus alba]|uniref:Uncharacterized protein n=1 Tax=Populus alba TaxID=43335 RepID=A0ACC4C3T3_POPAL